MKKAFLILLLYILLVPGVLSLDNYFSVTTNGGPYSVSSGDTFYVDFTVSNRDLLYPKNVTAYIDPCPFGWTCESKTLSYNSRGVYPVNLSIVVPKTALPKKYTLYILLRSEWNALRGDDRVLVTVFDKEEVASVPYNRFAEEQKAAALKSEQAVEEDVTAIENKSAVAVIDQMIPVVNVTGVVEDVETLGSSKQFLEYFSVVLSVLLVFIAVGIYTCFHKKKKK